MVSAVEHHRRTFGGVRKLWDGVGGQRQGPALVSEPENQRPGEVKGPDDGCTASQKQEGSRPAFL